MPDFLGLFIAQPQLFVTAGNAMLAVAGRLVATNEEFTGATSAMPGWTGESRQAHDGRVRTISSQATTLAEALEKAGTTLVSGGTELTALATTLRSEVEAITAALFIVIPSGLVILGPAQYAEAAATVYGAEAVIAAYEAEAATLTTQLEGIVAQATAVDGSTAAQLEAAGTSIGVSPPGPNPLISGTPVTITLTYRQGMPKAEFLRKAEALKALGDRGMLFRAPTPVPRDRRITDGYRTFVEDRIEQLYGGTDIGRTMTDGLGSMSPDHVWELQLGGPDRWGNLSMLDRGVNVPIGLHQIRPQIQGLPDYTPIRIQIVGP
jgi:uncharacterized protein YukE